MQVDNVYRMADVVVARAGANTVAEILATQRPSILIPIPWTYLNEQQKNAEYAQKLGNVKVIHQNKFKKRILLSTIKELIDNWNSKPKSKQKKLDIHASKEIVNILKGI